MPKILYTPGAINQRLKGKGSKVRVEVRGAGAINLRATLPPKPGTGRPLPYQQRIPLNMKASPESLKKAEYEADKLHGAILYNTFEWSNYVVVNSDRSTGRLIEKFKQHYLSEHSLTLRTWQNNWVKYLSRLPQDKPLTVEALEKEIRATRKNSATRRSICSVYGHLADFAGIPHGLERFKITKLDDKKELVIPPDELLFDTRKTLKCATEPADSGWRWVYSIMLLAGLRPHECFFCKWSDEGLEVLQGKTGPRTVFYETFDLLYPGLLDEWGMKTIKLPGIKAQSAYEKGTLGNKVNIQWSRWKLPFTPYALRHAFALRTSVVNADKFPLAIAAALMGHSEEVHSREYHRWLSKQRVKDVLKQSLKD